MRYTRLENESDEYVAAREQLRLAEIELLEHRERVAVLRRGLPPGATVDDYEFAEGPTLLEDGDEPQTKVRLSELFTGDDLGSEDADGNQTSTISVFDRDADGTVRHTYTAHPHWSETGHQRGLDLLSPVWHLLDLTPQGRGDWYASLRTTTEFRLVPRRSTGSGVMLAEHVGYRLDID